jgi:hypothetical protein
MTTTFTVGDRVRIRSEYRRSGDFEMAVVAAVDPNDNTVDVEVDGRDWGQWFSRLDDGTYEIEQVIPVCAHCGREIEDDDDGRIWYHPDTMSARCDGPDDEPGLYWSDMVRQAEPA